MVEYEYSKSSLSQSTICRDGEAVGKGNSQFTNIESLRKSLGHPLPSLHPMMCMVASLNGMDSESLSERATVAGNLWAGGISAEYIPQSGGITSLLQNRTVENSRFETHASVRTLEFNDYFSLAFDYFSLYCQHFLFSIFISILIECDFTGLDS